MTSALLVIDVQEGLCSGPYAALDSARVIKAINAVAEMMRLGPLQQESTGWQLADGLVQSPSDLRLRKRASDAFHQTELHNILQGLGVDHLIICGFQSDFCVDSTTRRALAQGYPVTLVSDGHSTLDNGVLTAAQIIAHHNLTLGNISGFGCMVEVVPSSEIQAFR